MYRYMRSAMLFYKNSQFKSNDRLCVRIRFPIAETSWHSAFCCVTIAPSTDDILRINCALPSIFFSPFQTQFFNFIIQILPLNECIWIHIPYIHIKSNISSNDQTIDACFFAMSAFAIVSIVCSTCEINANHAHRKFDTPVCGSRERTNII